MFTIYKKIDRELRNCLAEAMKIPEVPLVFGHICWGVLTQPGAFRMTKIESHDQPELPLTTFSIKHHVSHEEAFRRHIKRFGRSGTLLDWVTLWMYKNISFGRGHFEAVGELILRVQEKGRSIKLGRNSLTLSREFYDTLLPEEIAYQYLETLYSIPETSKDEYSTFTADQLVGARGVAFRRLATDPKSMRDISRMGSCYGTSPKGMTADVKYREWMFAGALQTGLMYVEASRMNRLEPQGFISIACGYNVLANGKPKDNPLAILSAVLPSNATEDQASDIAVTLKGLLQGSIKTQISNIRTFRDRPSMDVMSRMKSERWNPDSLKPIISRAAKKAFAVHAFPQWASALTLWLSLVTEQMRDSVHEGQMLNFSFVVADRSQIADSGLFELVDLEFSDSQDLLPWNTSGEPLSNKEPWEVLDRMQRDVGKKNYAWFQEGKYALLWDATFPRRHPQSLIRFKDSSWDVFINQARMGKTGKASEIIGAMTYVRADSSGGVILTGKQVLSFRRRQKWAKGGGKRHEKLRDKLLGYIGEWQFPSDLEEQTVSVFCEALAAIADDPHSGCILVIYSKGASPSYENMGEPWRTVHAGNPLMMSRDELTSLMSMDGASALFIHDSSPKVIFRSLVQPNNNVPKVNDVFRRSCVRINTQDARKHLDGEGSRKWSAAFAAMNETTDLVVAVSQDGPIYTFEKRRVLRAKADLDFQTSEQYETEVKIEVL